MDVIPFQLSYFVRYMGSMAFSQQLMEAWCLICYLIECGPCKLKNESNVRLYSSFYLDGKEKARKKW